MSERRVLRHLQLHRLSDRLQPEVPRIPLRVEAVEREVDGVSRAELAVVDRPPGEADRHVARDTAVDERRDVFAIA